IPYVTQDAAGDITGKGPTELMRCERPDIAGLDFYLVEHLRQVGSLYIQVEVSGKVLEATVHRAVTENAYSVVAERFPEEQAMAVPQHLVEGLFVLLAKGWVQVADIPQFGFQYTNLLLQYVSQR